PPIPRPAPRSVSRGGAAVPSGPERAPPAHPDNNLGPAIGKAINEYPFTELVLPLYHIMADRHTHARWSRKREILPAPAATPFSPLTVINHRQYQSTYPQCQTCCRQPIGRESSARKHADHYLAVGISRT